MHFKFDFTLSLQAILALVSVVVIALYPIVLAAFYSPNFLIANIPALIASALVILLFLGVRVYEINCFVYGGCMWHSWLMVSLSVLLTIVYCVYMTRFASQIQWDSDQAKAQLQEKVKDSMGALANNRVLTTITRGSNSSLNSLDIQ